MFFLKNSKTLVTLETQRDLGYLGFLIFTDFNPWWNTCLSPEAILAKLQSMVLTLSRIQNS